MKLISLFFIFVETKNSLINHFPKTGNDLKNKTLCADKNQNCRAWAKMGECDTNPKYMLYQSGFNLIILKVSAFMAISI